MGFIIYSQISISKQQQAIQDQVIQQKTLIDGIVQSANTYTTKADLQALFKKIPTTSMPFNPIWPV